MFTTRMPKARAGLLYSLFYSGQFVLLGIQLPFFAGWLSLHGFTAPEIGILTSLALISRLAIGPVIAYWADHQDDERHGLSIIAGLFAAGAIGLVVSPSKVWIGISAFAVLWAFGTLIPLTDTAVLRADRNGWLHYGRTRAVGSTAFLVTTILGGLLLSMSGVGAAAPAMAAAAVFAFAVTFLLPPQAGDRGGVRPVSWREAPRLLRSRVFVLVLISAGLTQGAHAVYYAFSYLRWSDIGYSDVTIGALWATGVGAEIFLLVGARELVRKISPTALLIIGGAAAALRWVITALEPPLATLFVVQLSHAATYAATYIGTLEFVDRAVPARLSNTAMTLMSATGVGAVTGIATAAAGFLWAGSPAMAYFLMAAMGAIAVILALLARRVWSDDKIFE